MSVYFARAGSGGPVKIGYSENPENRMVGLGADCKVPLRLIRTIDGNHRHEKWLHHYFRKSHIVGEWFEYDVEMLSIQPSDKPAPTKKREWLNFRISEYDLAKVDDWRRKEAHLRRRDMSRSEAIRELINEGVSG